MENHKKRWFKRKLYGWGWTPVTWQGWALLTLYVGCIVLVSVSLKENSSLREVVFRFILPLILITTVFIRIVYKTGEKPRWQWGKDEGGE